MTNAKVKDPVSASEASEAPESRNSALLRFAVLALLLLVALRDDVVSIIAVGCRVSDWSHVFALPVIAIVFVRLRSADFRAMDLSPSAWGLVLLIGGLLIWFATISLSLFGYLRVVALAIAISGTVLLSAGRSAFRVCIPLLIIVGLSFPLFERSMDRFTILLQAASLRAAAGILSNLGYEEVRVVGREIVRRVETSSVPIGLGELRFGFRMMQSCAIIGLLVIFSRKRSVWKLILLAPALALVLAMANILRIVIWSMASWWQGGSVADSMPQNLSAVASIIITFLGVGIIVFIIDRIPRLAGLFYVDDDGSDDSAVVDEGAST